MTDDTMQEAIRRAAAAVSERLEEVLPADGRIETVARRLAAIAQVAAAHVQSINPPHNRPGIIRELADTVARVALPADMAGDWEEERASADAEVVNDGPADRASWNKAQNAHNYVVHTTVALLRTYHAPSTWESVSHVLHMEAGVRLRGAAAAEQYIDWDVDMVGGFGWEKPA